MITPKQFRDRVDALWASLQHQAREKKWKSGARQGAIRKQAQPIHFTKQQLHDELMRVVGFNAIKCPYCPRPIDILSLTLDHIKPKSAGGAFSLPNLDAICKECNERKGNLSHDAFTRILEFRDSLSPYDRDIFWTRLKAAHHGAGQRFFRDKQAAEQKGQPKLPPPAATRSLDFEPF